MRHCSRLTSTEPECPDFPLPTVSQRRAARAYPSGPGKVLAMIPICESGHHSSKGSSAARLRPLA